MNADCFSLTVLNIPDIDRGVGLCLILRTPGGKTWLYDTGTGYPEHGGWQSDVNTGRDQVAPWLQAHGLSELDGVIISHAHYDHFGGLLWLEGNVPIHKLVDSGYEFAGWRDDHYNTELADFARLREDFRARGAWQGAVAGDTLDLDPALRVEVIAPPAEFFHEPNPEQRPSNNPAAHYMLNSNSLMLRITHGDVVFLLPGDIEKGDQARYLVPFVPAEKLRCDVLVAPGHGLHTAPEFVAATRPRVTVGSLFARWMGSCSAIPEFTALGSEVYITGLNGDIEVVSDGQGYEVHCEKL